MVRVSQIDHLTFVVSDLARTRTFYVKQLGMEEVDRPAFDFAGAWFRAGATLLHVIQATDLTGKAGINNDGRLTTTRGFHLAFAVDDAHAAEHELRQAGVEFVKPIKLRPDGAVQLFVFDPDRHIIELTSPPTA